MNVVLVKNANRMMTTASLLDDGIELSFADGLKGLIPYGEVPEVKVREGIFGLELPNPLRDGPANGWGRERRNSLGLRPALLRRYLPANRRAIAALGRQTVGERVRRFRESSGLTQQGLARAANIGRATLVRLEKENSPPGSRP